jgi:hypothetical protein
MIQRAPDSFGPKIFLPNGWPHADGTLRYGWQMTAMPTDDPNAPLGPPICTLKPPEPGVPAPRMVKVNARDRPGARYRPARRWVAAARSAPSG